MDAHAISNEEFEWLREEDRAKAAQYEPTTSPLPVSRLLNRDEEEEAVQTDPTGLSNLHFVRINGQLALAVPDGRLVDPKSTTIHRHDLFVIRVRGRTYYGEANLTTSTVAGTRLELRREPDNEHDPNAVAVIAPDTGERLGYVNRLQAKRLAKRLDAGEDLAVISLRGSPAGKDGDPLMVLITRPEILAHLEVPPANAGKVVSRDFVVSDPEVKAVDRYLAGTPPVHGLSRQRPRAHEVAQVRVGDELRVELVDQSWEVYNAAGVRLGYLRWRAADNGKPDARTGAPITYPERGVLHVTKIRTDGGMVADFGGYVTPA